MNGLSEHRRAILRPGDKVAVVSLSDGRLTQDFQIRKMQENLASLGLTVCFPKNARKSYETLRGMEGARLRAQDLKEVFADTEIKAVFAAIGGTDTYRTLPYLLSDSDFIASVQRSNLIFSGYSDTTTNHLMFYKLGLPTIYGPNGLSDLAELNGGILPYTKAWLKTLFSDTAIRQIPQSEWWYAERTSFTEEQIHYPRTAHLEEEGFDVLQGRGVVSGTLLGGCMETLTDLCSRQQNPEAYEVCLKYDIFPSPAQWANKVVFIESSASEIDGDALTRMLRILDEAGVFVGAAAVLVGKPQDKACGKAFRAILKAFFEQSHLQNIPVMINLPFGHGFPKCMLPYGKNAFVDFDVGSVSVDL